MHTGSAQGVCITQAGDLRCSAISMAGAGGIMVGDAGVDSASASGAGAALALVLQ